MPVTRIDAFKPVLLSSPALSVTMEQMVLIRKVLEVASSDTQFVNKAFDAIMLILTAGITKVPTVGTINPSTAVAGSGTVQLTVTGTEFTNTSEIVWVGSPVATTYVSATELKATVNVPAQTVKIPVRVQTGNIISDPKDFDVTAPV